MTRLLECGARKRTSGPKRDAKKGDRKCVRKNIARRIARNRRFRDYLFFWRAARVESGGISGDTKIPMYVAIFAPIFRGSLRQPFGDRCVDFFFCPQFLPPFLPQLWGGQSAIEQNPSVIQTSQTRRQKANGVIHARETPWPARGKMSDLR